LPIGQRQWAFLRSQVVEQRPKAFFLVLQKLTQFVMARFCVLWRVLGYGKLEQLLLLQIV
jgi:hypothetical protein